MLSNSGFSSPKTRLGELKGSVTDSKSEQPIGRATVILQPRDRKDTANDLGEFSFDSIPVGMYNILVLKTGYEPAYRNNILINTGKNKKLEIALVKSATLTLKTKTVVSSHEPRKGNQSTSRFNLTRDEINNSPGSAQDINKVLQTLPSVTITADGDLNHFLVRGGKSHENVFLIDGIAMDNLSHWGEAYSSGGRIGMLHLDFVKSVDFYAGAFPSSSPPRLSSVVDIHMRDGSFSHHKKQFDLNMAGAGFFLEGPIVRNKLSYMCNARMSFLKVVKPFIDVSGLPNYQNGQLKLSYNPGPKDKFDFSALLGNEKYDQRASQINSQNIEDRGRIGAGGLRWKHFFPFGKNALGLSAFYSRREDYVTKGNILEFDFSSTLRRFTLKDQFVLYIGESDFVETGVSGTKEIFEESIESEEYYTWARLDSTYRITKNHPEPGVYLLSRLDTTKGNDLFFSREGYTVGGNLGYAKYIGPFKFYPAIRLDYFDLLDETGLSPRLGITYNLSSQGLISMSIGQYYQFPSYISVASFGDSIKTDVPLQRTRQAVFGYERQLWKQVTGGVECYYKHYDREREYSLDLDKSAVSASHSKNQRGEKQVYGIELYLHKKIQDRFYYQLSYTWYMSERLFSNNKWYTSEDNYRNSAVVILGSNFHKEHGLSLRLDFSEGRPYTPVDRQRSFEKGEFVYDLEDGWNSRRFDVMTFLSVRYSSRSNFAWGSITSYLEVQNVLNQKSVLREQYARGGGGKNLDRIKIIKAGTIFPVGGIVVDF